MKRIASIITASMLAISLGLAGCSNATGTQTQTQESQETQQTQVVTETQETKEATPQSEQMVGGWTAKTDGASTLTDEERATFEKAVADTTDMAYDPKATLATQVVAGTNYAFLCTGKPANEQGQERWYVVKVYLDLQGNASMMSSTPLNIDEM